MKILLLGWLYGAVALAGSASVPLADVTCLPAAYTQKLAPYGVATNRQLILAAGYNPTAIAALLGLEEKALESLVHTVAVSTGNDWINPWVKNCAAMLTVGRPSDTFTRTPLAAVKGLPLETVRMLVRGRNEATLATAEAFYVFSLLSPDTLRDLLEVDAATFTSYVNMVSQSIPHIVNAIDRRLAKAEGWDIRTLLLP